MVLVHRSTGPARPRCYRQRCGADGRFGAGETVDSMPSGGVLSDVTHRTFGASRSDNGAVVMGCVVALRSGVGPISACPGLGHKVRP